MMEEAGQSKASASEPAAVKPTMSVLRPRRWKKEEEKGDGGSVGWDGVVVRSEGGMVVLARWNGNGNEPFGREASLGAASGEVVSFCYGRDWVVVNTFCRVYLHFLLLGLCGLGLLGCLEQLLVDSFHAGVFDGREDFGAEFRAVALFGAGAETFGHCGGW
jgi:hypothetical protein